ncbi:hypothetical protein CCP4SC76_1270004 [Gammaproteobacteria bacterium]
MIAGALRLSKLTGQNGSNIPEFLEPRDPMCWFMRILARMGSGDQEKAASKPAYRSQTRYFRGRG